MCDRNNQTRVIAEVSFSTFETSAFEASVIFESSTPACPDSPLPRLVPVADGSPLSWDDDASDDRRGGATGGGAGCSRETRIDTLLGQSLPLSVWLIEQEVRAVSTSSTPTALPTHTRESLTNQAIGWWTR